MSTLDFPVPRAVGWGASVVLHGGAAAFLLLAPPSPQPPPAIVPLEIAAITEAPAGEAVPPTDAAAPAEAIVAETGPPETVAVEPPPEAVVVESTEEVSAAKPEPLQAVEPEIVRAAPPEAMKATAPDVAPIAEDKPIPLPPPAAPPPPPRAARPTVPPPPPPASRHPDRPPSAASYPVDQALAQPLASATRPSAEQAPLAKAAAGPPPSYVARLLAALERAKRYVDVSRLGRGKSVALLRVRMRRDGSVMQWRIERSTGQEALDRAAAEMIRRASLPPVPEEMGGTTIELVVPVQFNIR